MGLLSSSVAVSCVAVFSDRSNGGGLMTSSDVARIIVGEWNLDLRCDVCIVVAQEFSANPTLTWYRPDNRGALANAPQCAHDFILGRMWAEGRLGERRRRGQKSRRDAQHHDGCVVCPYRDDRQSEAGHAENCECVDTVEVCDEAKRSRGW